MRKKVLFIIFLFLLSGKIPAQNPGYPGSVYVSATGRKRSAAEIETMKKIYDNQKTNTQIERLNSGNRSNSNVTFTNGAAELAQKAKKYLVPDLVFQTQYQNFLKLPNTGLIQILPAKVCISNDDNAKLDLSKIIENCPFHFVTGNARYYSFRQKDYSSPSLADIGIQDNYIFSLGIFNQAIMVNLGETAIENISLTTKGIDFLGKFSPTTNLEESDRQFKQFEDGVQSEGLLFQKILPLEDGKTYGLRVIAYRGNFFYEYKSLGEKIKYYPLKGDRRDDIIVAFKVLKKGDDGNVILLWKELQRVAAPEMVVPKKNS